MNRFVIRPPNVHFVRLGGTYNGQWPGSLLVQRTAPGTGQDIYFKVIMVPVPVWGESLRQRSAGIPVTSGWLAWLARVASKLQWLEGRRNEAHPITCA